MDKYSYSVIKNFTPRFLSQMSVLGSKSMYFFRFFHAFTTKKKNIPEWVIWSATSFIICYILKVWVGRHRPNEAIVSYSIRQRMDSSMPSWHALFSRMNARYHHSHYHAAILISLSRIILQKHWCSDVIVGASIGYIIGKIAYSTKKS